MMGLERFFILRSDEAQTIALIVRLRIPIVLLSKPPSEITVPCSVGSTRVGPGAHGHCQTRWNVEGEYLKLVAGFERANQRGSRQREEGPLGAYPTKGV